jgi:hypothetical protein
MNSSGIKEKLMEHRFHGISSEVVAWNARIAYLLGPFRHRQNGAL